MQPPVVRPGLLASTGKVEDEMKDLRFYFFDRKTCTGGQSIRIDDDGDVVARVHADMERIHNC